MAGPFGVRFEFKELWDKTSGWSMGFWNNAASLVNAVAAARAAAQTVLNACGNQVFLGQCRIHDASNPRSARIVELPGLTGYTPGLAQSVNNTMTPLVALLLRAYDATSVLKAEYELRGIEQKLVAFGGQFSGAPSAALAAFIAMLAPPLGNPPTGWVLRGKDPARPKQSILGISPTGLVTMAGPLDLTGSATVGNVGVVYLERVRLGVKARTFAVSSNPPGGSTLQLIIGGGNFPATSTVKASAVRPIKYITAPIAEIAADKITTHRVGRPSDLSTGRHVIRPY